MKRLLLLLAVLFALAFPACAGAEDYTLRPLGAIPSPVMDYPQYMQPETGVAYPEEYTWPYLLPEALDQGPYGMCVAYSLRAIKDMLALENGVAENHSAAFIYANRDGSGHYGEGMVPYQALYRLMRDGTCLDSLFPLQGTFPDLQ